jgi:glyoxalase family protein
MKITGLHHVTAIASDPQRNLDFYAGVLGLRLVKRTVNFDDPGSYHFYFGDEAGSPGTILTFFPWPHARRGVRGAGEVEATAFAIPEHSLGHWQDRLKARGVSSDRRTNHFGEEVIRFADPDGMLIELTGTAGADPGHALRGFHGVTATVHAIEPTSRLLIETFGYRLVAEEGNRFRFSAEGGSVGRHVDLLHCPDEGPGRSGAGSVHHIAFRVPDDQTQTAARRTLASFGYGVSPVMDRAYFHSIYFREPGGILFELATDGPGFTTDEKPETLGEALQLPSWMESSRSRIEAILPTIHLPERKAA